MAKRSCSTYAAKSIEHRWECLILCEQGLLNKFFSIYLTGGYLNYFKGVVMG